MALARFEIYPLRRPTAVPGTVSWRLLATNNRDLGRAAAPFPDVPACLASIGTLRRAFRAAVPVATRDGRAVWTWRVQLDGLDLAVSSRGYQRRVQAEHACAIFLDLVPAAAVTESTRR
jgi:hypothetical protein